MSWANEFKAKEHLEQVRQGTEPQLAIAHAIAAIGWLLLDKLEEDKL